MIPLHLWPYKAKIEHRATLHVPISKYPVAPAS